MKSPYAKVFNTFFLKHIVFILVVVSFDFYLFTKLQGENVQIFLIIISFLVFTAYGFYFLFSALKQFTFNPAAGVQPLSLVDLKQRLLDINNYDIPFVIEVQDEKIICRWKDEVFSKHLSGSSSQSQLQQIKLEFDEQKFIVKVKNVSLKSDGSKSISFFHPTQSVSGGLHWEDGKYQLAAHDYKYESKEMKTPLLEVILGSGWKWVPRLF